MRFSEADYASGARSVADSSSEPVARKARLAAILFVGLLWGGVIIWRLASLQIFNFSQWQDWALKQHFSHVKLSSERGPILDRTGDYLAVSIPAGSVYVRPGQVQDPSVVAEKLSKVLDVPVEVILTKATSRKPFVWVKRQVPRLYAKRVKELELKGVGYVLESKRFYPYNQAASALLGKVGIDGNGLSGLEQLFEKQLYTEHTKTRVVRDALGKVINVGDTGKEGFALPKGKPLTLTLDSELQMIVDEELERGWKDANAKGALALLVNSRTGDILSMSQMPAYNFNKAVIADRSALTNQAVESVFEPGSIMKPIVVAAALEEGVVNEDNVINCENGRFRFGRHTIKDVHGNEDLSVHDIVVRSSNIGMTKIGARLGRERLYDWLTRFGFGEGSGLDLPGESSGILRNVKNWREIDIATHSFGQGIATTPLQIVRAVSAIANDGVMPRLRLIEDKRSSYEQVRVVSVSTAKKVQRMMVSVVEDEHGTGKRAGIPDVRIGGKTGTAQKARTDGRGYADGKYVASFVGFTDLKSIGLSESLVLLVSIDEPDTTSIYGGTLAGPVYKRIMQRALQVIATRERVHSKKGLMEASIDGGEPLWPYISS